MKNCIIITNSNPSITGGNITLIERRAFALYEQMGLKTYFLTISRFNPSLGNESIQYVSISSIKDIRHFIRRLRPVLVVFYGSTLYLLIGPVKRMLNHYKIRSNIALDIQGTIKESIEYPTSHLDYLKYHFERILENRALTKSDIVFVVTDQQKRDLENVLKHKRHMNTVFYQIRCGVDRVLTIEEKTYNRAKYRQRMGVQGDQTVFVYSGNRSKWQKINDVISYFKDIDRFLSNCFFAFFCNADDELKKQLSLSFDNNNYLCKLNNKDDYMGYLCACDVGIILRDYNNTNRVAFPNKFSDYLNAGLLIAMNKAIPEPYDLLLQYNIPFINTDIRPVERELDKIMYRKRNLYSYYDGCNRLCWNELDYQEQISKAQIKLD